MLVEPTGPVDQINTTRAVGLGLAAQVAVLRRTCQTRLPLPFTKARPAPRLNAVFVRTAAGRQFCVPGRRPSVPTPIARRPVARPLAMALAGACRLLLSVRRRPRPLDAYRNAFCLRAPFLSTFRY